MAFIEMSDLQEKSFAAYCEKNGWTVQRITAQRIKVYINRSKAIICSSTEEFFSLLNS